MAFTPMAGEAVFAHELGLRLRRARLAAGLTSLSEAARAIGCSRSALVHWEEGENEPRASALVKMAEVYRVSVVDLLGVA